MIPRLRKQEGSCLVVVLLIIVVILGIALLASYDESQETTDVEAVDVSALKKQLANLTFDDLARYPDQHKGKAVSYSGKVVQKISETAWRVNITQGPYGIWEDTVYLEIRGDARKVRVLEDDIIEFTGIANGERTGTTIFGQKVTLPRITVYEVVLVEKRQ